MVRDRSISRVRLLDEAQGHQPFDVSFANVLDSKVPIAMRRSVVSSFGLRWARKLAMSFSCNAFAATTRCTVTAVCNARPKGRGSCGWEKGEVAARL